MNHTIHPGFFLLYVDSPTASAAFYRALLNRDPVEESPGFAMFRLDSGVMLCLWARAEVQPEPTRAAACGGGAELAFAVADAGTVDAWHQAWSGRGLPIVQTPTQMDFGYTFVAADPDAHRLRVFAPGGAA